ncbi:MULTISPECIES: SCO1860 family LAETG-anchored protein [Streptomyces]|uniref:SCO1860 family LAETG-anchored protein n=1 Tax=Streptomyces luteosporeus TaxID=173856 RepID=A0ABP6GG12_9ACTN
MSSTTSPSFGMPARRPAALLALVLGALTLGAAPAPAQATGTTGAAGTAEATVLRTGLDVAVLGRTAHVPVDAVLNDVRAPGDATRTTLAVSLDGIEEGRPVGILRADAATAHATADRTAAKARAEVAGAVVRLPGLPVRPLLQARQITAEAVCETGRTPAANAHVPGSVSVLGKKVTLTANGPTDVTVPGVGHVRLALSQSTTTTRTAAATALDLDVAVDPLALGVAKVTGKVTLARATCSTPEAQAPDVKPQTAATRAASAAPVGRNLAETGGSSTTPYLLGGAGLLVAAGGAALIAARRRKG